MKCATTILCSLLLFEVCNGKDTSTSGEAASETGYQRRTDEQRERDIYARRDDFVEPRTADDDGERKKTFPSASEIKDVVIDKLGDLLNTVTGHNDAGVTYPFGNVPPLQDPVDIGNAVDRQPLATINYENVQFYGLNSSYNGTIKIDTASNRTMVRLPLKRGQIRGRYSTTYLLRKASGEFVVNLLGNVTAVQNYAYSLRNNEVVQVAASSSQIEYTYADSKYENIGLLARAFQGILGKLLTKMVNDKILIEVGPKLSGHVQDYIEKAIKKS